MVAFVARQTQPHQHRELALGENPPAPKVPRRGSLAASDTDRSVRLVQLQLGCIFERSRLERSARDYGNFHILQIGRNRPHGPLRSNMATTLARLGVSFGQQGPQLGPIGPQDSATWPELGPQLQPIWEQLRPKLKSIWLQMREIAGPIRHPQNARFLLYFPRFFAIDEALFEAMFPYVPHVVSPLGPTKLSPKGVKLRHVRTDLDFHAQ